MKNNKGFSLVELAIGLAVLTILILAITVSAGIRDNARVQSAGGSIQSLRSAAENFLSNGNLNYANLSFTNLQGANLLPAGFTPASTNPWGGDYVIAPNASDNTRFDIAMTAIPTAHAAKLTNYFSNSASATAYDASQSTWTVTF